MEREYTRWKKTAGRLREESVLVANYLWWAGFQVACQSMVQSHVRQRSLRHL